MNNENTRKGERAAQAAQMDPKQSFLLGLLKQMAAVENGDRAAFEMDCKSLLCMATDALIGAAILGRVAVVEYLRAGGGQENQARYMKYLKVVNRMADRFREMTREVLAHKDDDLISLKNGEGFMLVLFSCAQYLDTDDAFIDQCGQYSDFFRGSAGHA